MGIADEATSWLYGKVRDKVIDAQATATSTTLGESPVSPPLVPLDGTDVIIQLAQQRARRAKFDKWLKRLAALAFGAGGTYVYLTFFAKRR